MYIVVYNKITKNIIGVYESDKTLDLAYTDNLAEKHFSERPIIGKDTTIDDLMQGSNELQ